MAGLVEKDIRLLWGNKQSLLLLFAFAVIFGFAQEGTFILGYLPFIVIIFTINTIAYDELDNGYQFLMTLPVDARMYVKEKYMFCLSGGILSWLTASVIYFIAKIFRGARIDFMAELPMIVAFLPAIVLMSAVMIPMQLKFGVEKSRAVVAGICGGIGAIVLAFAKFAGTNRNNIFTVLDHMSGGMIVCLAIVLCVLVTAVSYLISVKIMKKKEF